jgi:hypothetical protein
MRQSTLERAGQVGNRVSPARHGSAFGTGREEWKILALHEPRLLDGALAGA